MRGRLVVLAALAAAALAALSLWVRAGLFDPSRLHVHGAYGDQAGYVTTARILADEGRLESGLVYPAFADRPAWRPYMPGHYAALALAYRLLGYGVLPSLLPNLLAACFTAAALVVIGARLAPGKRAGLLAGGLAALLYLLVPANVAYAFTAMAEPTLQAACAVAFAAFLLVPARHRPWAGALCLALPFLFRETAALLVLPMAFVVAGDESLRSERLRRVATLAGLSVLLLGGLLAWQSATGRGGFPLASWVVDGRFNYRDALAEPPQPTAGEWVAALGSNLVRNASETARQLRLAPLDPAVLSYVAMLALAAIAAALGLRRRDPFLLGTSALVAAVLLLLYATYDVKAHKALRSTMFVQPFVLLAAARAATGLRARPRTLAWAAGVPLVLLAAGSHERVRRAAEDMRRGDESSLSAVHILQTLQTDPGTALLAPHEMIKQFAVEAYPTRVGFHPANDATLELVSERFPIGTLVLPDPDPGTKLSSEALRAAGLYPSPQRIGGERTGYAIWTRPPRAPGRPGH